MPTPDYFAIQAVNWSRLKILIDGTPMHYRYALDHPDDGDTYSRIALRAIHCAVLEPDRFNALFPVYPGKDRRAAGFQAFLDAHPGCSVITKTEQRTALDIQRAVHEHPESGRILSSQGWAEKSITWTDPTTGMHCKGCLDWIQKPGPDGVLWIWDLKTWGSASEHEVRWMIRKGHTLGQLSHYRAGMQVRNPGKTVRCGLIVAEGKPPHDVGVFEIDDQDLAEADDQRQDLLRVVADCTRLDSWPGYCSGRVRLKMEDMEIQVPITEEEEP